MKKVLLFTIALVFSSSSFAADAAQSAGSPLAPILMLVVFAVFWFLLIRPQQKKNKKLRQMLSEISKGDEVVTNGGIVGKIVKLDEVMINLEIADNVIVKLQRNAIANILPKGTMKV